MDVNLNYKIIRELVPLIKVGCILCTIDGLIDIYHINQVFEIGYRPDPEATKKKKYKNITEKLDI
jgi:hypothetical protein